MPKAIFYITFLFCYYFKSSYKDRSDVNKMVILGNVNSIEHISACLFIWNGNNERFRIGRTVDWMVPSFSREQDWHNQWLYEPPHMRAAHIGQTFSYVMQLHGYCKRFSQNQSGDSLTILGKMWEPAESEITPARFFPISILLAVTFFFACVFQFNLIYVLDRFTVLRSNTSRVTNLSLNAKTLVSICLRHF